MRAAVVSLTENGRILSQKLHDALSADHEIMRYCFVRHSDGNSVVFGSIYGLTAEIFSHYDALIFVCACGIAVRAIAPHVKSKATDPAVVVVDECGKFAVSVLSGHLGGANRLAELIAEKIGATAVVTTATDTGKRFSPDSFAAANALIIGDLQAAKAVAAAVLENEKIGFVTEYEHSELPAELTETTDCRIGIAVTENAETKPFAVTLSLVPRNLVLGIGCKRGTAFEEIEALVNETFETENLEKSRICAVSTIDIKSGEQGILDFCRAHGVPLRTFTAAELMAADGDFERSEFVLKTVGTDNVCERSAVLGSEGKLILRKNARNGVTLAVAEKSVYLDFERKIL